MSNTGLATLYRTGFKYLNHKLYNYLRFKENRNKTEEKILNVLEKDFYGIVILDCKELIFEKFNYYNPPIPQYFIKWVKNWYKKNKE